MTRAAILIFSMMLVPRAFALEAQSCEARLGGQVPAELTEALATLKNLGLSSLLAETGDKKISIVRARQWLTFQAAVSARVSKWTGRKSMVIRNIDVSTPKKKQTFTWEVAIALYELQMQPWLWSGKSIYSAAPALAMEEDHDALAYFALQMPKEWRDEYLAKTKSMLRELYVLFLTLPDLRAEDLMAADDPGRGWVLHTLFGQNGAHAIAPNLTDFTALKSKGLGALEANVDANNSKSVLFSYYMNHVKRMLIATFVGSNLLLAPHLLEIPSYIEAQREWSKYQETLNEAPTRARATELKTVQLRREREIRRLTHEIEVQEAKPERDEATISRLRMELQTNVDYDPSAAYESTYP